MKGGWGGKVGERESEVEGKGYEPWYTRNEVQSSKSSDVL